MNEKWLGARMTGPEAGDLVGLDARARGRTSRRRARDECARPVDPVWLARPRALVEAVEVLLGRGSS